MRIAYLASPVTMPGSPTRRPDAFEHDQMMGALAGHGADYDDVSWDDANADWSQYDAALIGTTWDYWDRVDTFLPTLDRIAEQTRLYNNADLVRWNIHKRYLRDLETRGAKLIQTLWLDTADEAASNEAFDQLGSGDLVFKRQIGAGAAGQHRIRRGEPIPAMPHPMMVQPFLKAIQGEGEYSFIFIDGELSHTLVKRAASGDYRIQSAYGGVEEAVTPIPEDRAAAKAIIDTLDEPPLYGRVDMVRGSDGRLLLMELELIEPFLYPLQGPELGARVVRALEKRLA